MKKYAVAIVAGLVLLAGYWLVAPYFVTVTVNDDLDPELVAMLEKTKNADRPMITAHITDGGIIYAEPTEQNRTGNFDNNTQLDVTKPMTVGPLPIQDTPGHPATGIVRTITTPEKQIVRFENYNGTNGPDLFVYLAKDLEATEFVNLGRAKGNMGNINYEVPDDVDMSEYKYVMTWCRLFGVLFDYAEIN